MTNSGCVPASYRTVKPGELLRRLRMRLGLSTRKVAQLSRRVAVQQDNNDFCISHARLIQIENEQSIPSIHKLFSLSCVYGIAVQDLFSLFFDLQSAEQTHASMRLPNTHLSTLDDNREPGTIPFPAHLRSTAHKSGPESLSNMMQAWSEAPVSLLKYVNSPKISYGLIGLSDQTMSPLIPPGSVVQIQPCRKIAKALPYRTELDRPVYFLESRSGYLCSWCEVHDGKLFSIPHPLSPCQTRLFEFPGEVEIIGRVTGVAIHFGRYDSPTFHGRSAHIESGATGREKATAG